MIQESYPALQFQSKRLKTYQQDKLLQSFHIRSKAMKPISSSKKGKIKKEKKSLASYKKKKRWHSQRSSQKHEQAIGQNLENRSLQSIESKMEQKHQLSKILKPVAEKQEKPSYRLILGLRNRKKKEYFCNCGYKTRNICHLKRHKNKCRHLLIFRKSSIDDEEHVSIQQNERYLPDFQTANNQSNGLRDIIKSTLDELLEEKLQIIGKNSLYLSNINPITLKIFDSIQKGIKQSIITNMRAVLEEKIINDPKYLIKPKQIGRQILRLVSEIDFNRCVLSYHDELEKAHRKIQEKIADKSSRTYSNNERCFQKFKNLSEIDLRNAHRIYDLAADLQKFVRQDMRRYLNLIKKQSLFLSQLQQFPIISDSVAKRARIIPISYISAANDIQRLFQSGQRQLATDMWATMVLALRADDLLKIRLFNSSGIPVKIIRLREKKTGSIVDRYVPKSLIELAYAANTSYPMTSSRLKRAVKQCLVRYRSAYGFKHRAITQIIVSLAQSNKFLNFHRKASMTFRYYLDKNQQKLLDLAFKHGITFLFDQNQVKSIENRRLIFDGVNQNDPLFKQISEETLAQVTIDCRQDIEQRIISTTLDLIKPNQEVLAEVKQEHLGQIYYLKEKYDLNSTNEDTFKSIQKCVSSICSPPVYDNIEGQVYKDEIQNNELDRFCESLSKASNSPVILHEFEDQNVEPLRVRKIQLHEVEVSPTVITSISKVNGEKTFRIFPSNDLTFKPVRRAKAAALKNFIHVFLQKHKTPRCPNCLKSNKISFLIAKNKILVCQSEDCQFKDENVKHNLQQGRHKFYIQSEGQYPIKLRCPMRTERKNNLQEQMGKQFGLSNIYSSTIPNRAHSKLLSFDLQANEIDRFLRIFHYLPVHIKDSSIEGAGKGMYATADIQQNSIIGIYTGFVGNHFQINERSNSLFGLGWYCEHDHWYQIFSDGCISNSGSRFINTAKDSQINIKSFQGVFRKEILILYITARNIVKGQELFIKYGSSYHFEQQFDQFIA